MLLMFGVAVGCTGNSAEPAGSSERAPALSGGFGTRHVTLTCVDAKGVLAVVGAKTGLTVGDVVFGGFTRVVSSIPRAEDVRLQLPHGVHWYFRKAPIVLKADATTVTVSVAASGQALAWVPFDVWTSGTPPDLRQWSARSVTVHNCPGKNTSFLGGLLAARPTACLVLQVRSRGEAEQTVRRRLNGTFCTR